jgi:ABC-type transport system involved in cytochrome c biogenesis permease component
MTASFWFWIFFVLTIVLRGFAYGPEQRTFRYIGPDLLWYILIFLLGYHVFGSPMK